METNKKSRLVSGFIIGTFVSLYLMVSVISTIHVIDFFKLSNPTWLAISLAIAFEVGAAASLASLIAMQKMNKTLVWFLFILLTGMQAMGNTYYAYINLGDFSSWSELFGLIEEELTYQKRVLSIVSGAILPIVALGFIKSLVDYIKPDEEEVKNTPDTAEEDTISSEEYYYDLQDSMKPAEGNISEPLIHDLGDAGLLNDNSEETEKIKVDNTADLPNYKEEAVAKTPISQGNQEIVNVNQNKETANQRKRPTMTESPTSLDANPTRI